MNSKNILLKDKNKIIIERKLSPLDNEANLTDYGPSDDQKVRELQVARYARRLDNFEHMKERYSEKEIDTMLLYFELPLEVRHKVVGPAYNKPAETYYYSEVCPLLDREWLGDIETSRRENRQLKYKEGWSWTR